MRIFSLRGLLNIHPKAKKRYMHTPLINIAVQSRVGKQLLL